MRVGAWTTSRPALWAALAVSVMVAACGGGGGDAGTPSLGGGTGTGGGPTAGPVAADLSIALTGGTNNGGVTLPNNATDRITATVTAVDGNRNALSGIPVTISVNSKAVASVSGTATGSQGTVTANIGLGDDRSNRTITVTASSGTLTRSATFQVIGARITGTAVPAVVAPGVAAEIQFRVLDVNGNALPGLPITVTGVGAAEAVATTGSNGDYKYIYTAPGAGSIDVVASAAGVTFTQTVLVQSSSSSIPPVNQLTDSVSSASVSANPSVVPVNDSSSSNRSEIRALFLKTGNAPIQNVRVRFDLNGDPSSIGGTFTSGNNIVYSSASGVAAAAYVPAGRSSPTGGVTVRACWDYRDFAVGACPNAATTTLTVISEPLSVTIGTSNKIEEGASGQDYIKKYVVQVVDSSGLAKPNVQITPSIDLLRYFKGVYTKGAEAWERAEQASCDNEDLNRNGVSETYLDGVIEDANGSFNPSSGRPALEPRKADVAISFVGSSTTDVNGQVVIQIRYPQSVASWVEFNILVAASGVSGTEGRANYQGTLPVLQTVLTNLDTDPPFRDSPYGRFGSAIRTVLQTAQHPAAQLCTNPN